MSRLFPSPAPGIDSCSARVFSVFSSNSAMKAAAAAAFRGGISLNFAIAGTAAAAASKAAAGVASVQLKASTRHFGRFGIVSSGSNGAAAGGKRDKRSRNNTISKLIALAQGALGVERHRDDL
jgi:hypothetical protein